MSYEDLLSKIYEELPQLRGQLHSPHVVYLRPQGKVYITFQSNVLVEEAAFLKMERILRQVFSQKPLALRVVSPALAEDFLAHIEDYKQVFIDFLKRNYPASISWMDQMDWRCDGERITLTFPDPFSLEFMGRQGVSARLAQAVKDIFGVDVKVELTVAGDQEARLAALREERMKEQGEEYRPLPETERGRFGVPAGDEATGIWYGDALIGAFSFRREADGLRLTRYILAPEWRGRRLGVPPMGQVLRYCRHQALPWLRLTCADPALRLFFARLGFVAAEGDEMMKDARCVLPPLPAAYMR